ncbi:MAG: hypothetical protein WAK17_01750 [Candidatus Nitrosopolaris sp.]
MPLLSIPHNACGESGVFGNETPLFIINPLVLLIPHNAFAWGSGEDTNPNVTSLLTGGSVMETSEYLTIVAIAVSMVLSTLGLFFGIMLRTKGPYRTGWTDVPIEQQLQDGEFRWPKGIRFMGKLPDCWRWMFVGLLITIALALIGIWKVGHP